MFNKTIKCKDTGEIVKGYNKYLNTEHWGYQRKRIARSRKYTCEKCGIVNKQHFHIHHLTYKRIGNEKPTDLVFLCKGCHENLHKTEITEFLGNISFLPSLKSKVEYTLRCKKDIKGLFEKHFNNFLEEVKKLDLQE